MYVSFPGQNPNKFKLFHEKHGLYFFRDLQGKVPRIKFNLCHAGNYNSQTPFRVEKIVGLEIPDNLPSLPSYERDKIKDFVIVDNPRLTTPARIFVDKGIIEKGSGLKRFPKPIRVFILLHEVGHFFYGVNQSDIDKANSMSENEGREYLSQRRNESEKKCDLFALVYYLKMGYNRSMAFYSLSTVLSRSQDNVDRVKELAKKIQITQKKSIYE